MSNGTLVMSIEEKLREIIADAAEVPPEQVKRETVLQEELGIDSLTFVEIIMKIEEDFEIDIPDEASEKMSTLGDAVDYMEKSLGIRQ